MSRANFQIRFQNTINQANAAITQLRIDLANLQEARQAVQAYIQERALRSRGYDLLKVKLQDYDSVLHLLMLAAELDILDNQTLKTAIGTEDIDGLEVMGEIERIDREIDNANGRLSSLRTRSAAWVTPNPLVLIATFTVTGVWLTNPYPRQITAVEGEIRDLGDERKIWDEKIEKYRMIADATANLFEQGLELRMRANSGLRFINGAEIHLPDSYPMCRRFERWRDKALGDIQNAEVAVLRTQLYP